MSSKPLNPVDFALKLLSIRDYGEAELKARMELKGISTTAADNVIKLLKEKKLINDEVLIGKIIEKYINKVPSSKNYIQAFLENKGFLKNQFLEALEGIDDLKSARKAFLLKFNKQKKSDNPMKIRQKASNYLQTKGFDYDIIDQILNDEIIGGNEIE